MAAATTFTVEARWIIEGPMPPLVGRLADAPTAARTDIYLRLDGDDANIKLRSGNQIEVKRRSWWAHHDLGDDVDARIEGWTKWTFPPHDDVFDELRHSRAWIVVNKRRWMLDLGGAPAGHLEIGQLSTDDTDGRRTQSPQDPARWWTLCVEIEADPADPASSAVDDVRGCISSFSDTEVRNALNDASACSYAQWLNPEPQIS